MDSQQSSASGLSKVSRRQFVKSVAGVGAGLALVQPTWIKAAAATDAVNVAVIGTGGQGAILVNRMMQIPGIRIQAVADIFEFNRTRVSRLAQRSEHKATPYEDYKELLAAESDLDAVVIATPDFVHAEQTNACLRAGLHVYCEKEMSNDIEEARSMVQTQRETGKLLQIGHQRRSNPYYMHAYNLTNQSRVFGDITHVAGQWNQAKVIDIGWPQRFELSEAALDKYGYGSMAEMRNWRWYRKYAGGPMADLGSHQVDIFNWFLNAPPKSLYATGSNARALLQAKEENTTVVPECEDNVLCVYEWDTPSGTVRGFYKVILTTSHGGFYETFMGTQGSFNISEISSRNAMFREARAPKQDWEDQAETMERDGVEAMTFDPEASREAQGRQKTDEDLAMSENLRKPPHQLHLENFFAAVRDGAKLTCDQDVGFETCVTVLKANDAIQAGTPIQFSESDFKA